MDNATSEMVVVGEQKSVVSRLKGAENLRNRRRLGRVAKWMRQSVSSMTTLDESYRLENVVGGLNKRWRLCHQKRTSGFLRELQLNPMLPFEVSPPNNTV